MENEKDQDLESLISLLSNSKSENYNILSYGKIHGKYKISSENIQDFLTRYINCINKGIVLSILEKQNNINPIIIDVDLKMVKEEVSTERLYNYDLVIKIINLYIDAIKTYLKINDDNLIISVFEKDKMKDLEDIYKDGFHIIFNNTICDIPTRHLIRREVINTYNNSSDKILEQYIESIEKIIDKSVVSSNNWFLYGSQKPDNDIYKLTKMYINKRSSQIRRI